MIGFHVLRLCILIISSNSMKTLWILFVNFAVLKKTSFIYKLCFFCHCGLNQSPLSIPQCRKVKTTISLKNLSPERIAIELFFKSWFFRNNACLQMFSIKEICNSSPIFTLPPPWATSVWQSRHSMWHVCRTIPCPCNFFEYVLHTCNFFVCCKTFYPS